MESRRRAGRIVLIVSALASLLISRFAFGGGPLSLLAERKPRVVVMTDIGGDPDDQQSLVRFLLYSCDFHVEGLCTGFGFGHYTQTRPDLIRKGIQAYAKVLPNLRRHRSDYPSAEQLLSLVKDGYNGDPHRVGPGMDSEASDWIVQVLERDDPRPVWFTIWGGPRELAQALWKLQKTCSPEKLARLKRKIRVYSIADQDRTAEWVKANHPDVFWIFSNRQFRGIWKEGDQSVVSPEWLSKHVLTDHGPLGDVYPPKAAGKDGVKEGDTPSFLYLVPNGLSDPEHPEWGGWGGRFRRSGRGHEYIPAEDLFDGRPDLLYPIHRWRRAFQNAFEARMDWCVKSFEQANHEPQAVCNGDHTGRVLHLEVKPQSEVSVSAVGSSDPDNDRLMYRWWTYREAGTYWDDVPIRNANSAKAVVQVPADAAGRTVHVILEVTDTGTPPLTSYRRIVLHVSGKPVPQPPGAFVEPEFAAPITQLGGPPNETGPWEFFRGVNINGPPIEIDGHRWDGDDADGFACTNRPLVNNTVRLLPPTDPSREKMIRSFRWDRKARLELSGLPKGTYAVYAYVWEETRPETFTIWVNGRVVQRDYYSGRPGQWRRLGPWIVAIDDGRLVITSSGGAANFSGVELWRRVKR